MIRACRGTTLARCPCIVPSPHILALPGFGQAADDVVTYLCLWSKPLKSRQILPLLSTSETESCNTDCNFSDCFFNLLVNVSFLLTLLNLNDVSQLLRAIFPGCLEKANLYEIGDSEGNRAK